MEFPAHLSLYWLGVDPAQACAYNAQAVPRDFSEDIGLCSAHEPLHETKRGLAQRQTDNSRARVRASSIESHEEGLHAHIYGSVRACAHHSWQKRLSNAQTLARYRMKVYRSPTATMRW